MSSGELVEAAKTKREEENKAMRILRPIHFGVIDEFARLSPNERQEKFNGSFKQYLEKRK
jgi:hypothetical protein